MDAIALTENGNLFSMVDFYKYAKKNHIKPIIGCEIQIKHDIHNSFSLVLLAKNNQGYLNLMKLVSLSYLNTANSIATISKELLQKYHNGLIATSSGLKGEITHYAAMEDYKNAESVALEYQKIFGENFYLEIQNDSIPD